MTKRRAQPPSRRRYDAASARRDLLDAAQKEFADRGYKGARLAAVAASARVKSGLIHFHFGGKEGLYAAVLERAFGTLQEDVARMLLVLEAIGSAPGASGLAPEVSVDLEPLGDALAAVTQTFYRQHGDVLALLRHAAKAEEPVAKRIADTYMRPVYQRVIGELQRLQTYGVINADLSAPHLFVSIVSMVAYPIIEPLFVQTVWTDRGVEIEGPAFDRERRGEVVKMALARMLQR